MPLDRPLRDDLHSVSLTLDRTRHRAASLERVTLRAGSRPRHLWSAAGCCRGGPDHRCSCPVILPVTLDRESAGDWRRPDWSSSPERG